MLKLLHIAGTRPQIIKSAALTKAIGQRFAGKIEEIKLDTGQHYDDNLGNDFYKELDLPDPQVKLTLQTQQPGDRLAEMIKGISDAIQRFRPGGVLVYGDTQSTLAGALAAYSADIPLFHVEAGLRSHNYAMPEERNRIMTDRMSTILFAPTRNAVKNLVREHYVFPAALPYTPANPGIVFCGDVMFDNFKNYRHKATPPVVAGSDRDFIFLTLHRNYNADEPAVLEEILHALEKQSQQYGAGIIFPVHPRTRKTLEKIIPDTWQKLQSNPVFSVCDPMSYFQTLWCLGHAALVVTDSGGLQKEAYFSGRHTVVLRPETEWTELVQEGRAVTTWHRTEMIAAAFSQMYGQYFEPGEIFGNGDAADAICASLLEYDA